MVHIYMIIKYLSFLLGIIWSYSFIKTQSIFSNKTAFFFRIFISKVSWLTFILACYFGFQNFSLKAVVLGVLLSIVIVHLVFKIIQNYLIKRFGEVNISRTKVFFEYCLLLFVIYYVFNWFQ